MKLDQFFPYRLALLAEAVSRSIAQVYADRFGITRDEWRVLAALADSGASKTRDVLELTTLDKMQVSRAVARLEARGLLEREPDPEDGRGQVLKLPAAGRALWQQIVPLVRQREAFLLAGLSAPERAALERALDGVLERARTLGEEEAQPSSSTSRRQARHSARS